MARNGAAVYEGCPPVSGRDSLIPAHARRPSLGASLGWPCPYGAAVQLQAKMSSGLLLNCVIYYYPKWSAAAVRSKHSINIDTVLEKYKSALKLFQAANADKRLVDAKSPDSIDLTRLAADFTTALLQATRNGRFPYSFKAVVIVPAYGMAPELPFWRGSPPWRGVYHGPWKNEFVGLAAADGHVIFDHIHVPMIAPPYFDLNLPPQPFGIKLHILVAMPAFFSCDSELPGCTLCAWGC